jgi:hypothetical protein
MLLKHLETKWVDLDLPFALHSCPLEAQIKTTYSSEEGAEGETHPA